MADGVTVQARQVLHALADLAPAAGQRSTRLSIPTEWFRWLGAEAASLFASGPGPAQGLGRHGRAPSNGPAQLFDYSRMWADEALRQLRAPEEVVDLLPAFIDRALGERFAAIDQI